VSGRGDRGSAAVEFVSIGVLLLVPLVYLALATGRVQAGTLAADAGARAAARAMTAADTESQGRARAAVAAGLALTDQGFEQQDGALAVRCDVPSDCLRPGNAVEAGLSVTVRLPGVPGFVDRVVPVRVTVRSRAVAAVDEFRSTR
jgi:hypothetical protein